MRGFISDDQRRAAFRNMFSKADNVSRGKRFEQKIHARLGRSDSVVTMRSTGSRGLWDMVAITPTKVRLVQAKTHGYLTPANREEMLVQLQHMPDNVQAELEYYVSPRVSKNFTLKKAGETDWDKVEERLEHFATVRGYRKKGAEDSEFSADDNIIRKLDVDWIGYRKVNDEFNISTNTGEFIKTKNLVVGGDVREFSETNTGGRVNFIEKNGEGKLSVTVTDAGVLVE
jgi:hypothetical protein